MTRIYTRTGDRGETSLFGGRRVPKDDLRVAAYGSVDELNAAIGMARAAGPGPEIDAVLEWVQHRLFDLGGELATPPDAAQSTTAAAPRVEAGWVQALEVEIDRFDDRLPPLRQFILPGGTPAAASLHLARTVARRAERDVIHLAGREPTNPELVKFLNRLSDLLFVLARAANFAAGQPDVVWTPGVHSGGS
jgi:cob(I)alamin adenosyltransferase